MGKLTEALKRAEEERNRRRAAQGLGPSAARGTPAATPPEPVTPSAPPAANLGTSAPPAANLGTSAPPEPVEPAAPVVKAEVPPAPTRALRQPARAPAPLDADGPARRLSERIVFSNGGNERVAEQFRHLRTTILAMNRPGQKDAPGSAHVIVITSTDAKEGKTITTANLIVALADYVAGPVLAVDGDLRRPGLHKFFGLDQAPGLSDVLRGSITLGEAVRRLDSQGVPAGRLTPNCAGNLHVLTSGRPEENPTPLIGSQGARDLVVEMRRTFRYVIIDTPPAMAVADAGILGAIADGALVVVRAGKTKRQDVKDALDKLAADGVRVLGTILNRKTYMAGYGYYYKKR